MRDYVDKITNKFLAWELPESVKSDMCVTVAEYKPRFGTNLLTFTEARKMVVYLFSELLDEHENLQKFATQYENKCVDLKSQLTTTQQDLKQAREEIEVLKAEIERYKNNPTAGLAFYKSLSLGQYDRITLLTLKLDKSFECYKKLADSCEWYADKGTEQERHHFLKVEALGNYNLDFDYINSITIDSIKRGEK